MMTLTLEGVLAERFGTSYTLAATSPHEAVLALCRMIDGFESFVRNNNFHIWLDDVNLDTDSVMLDTHKANTQVRMSLAVEGAGGNNGVFAIIAGIALIIVGFYMPAAWGAAAKMLAIGFGASLAAYGAGQMMMPTMNTDNVDEDGNRASYGFGGAITTTEQGNVVPVGYGELLQGGFVLTYRITSESVL